MDLAEYTDGMNTYGFHPDDCHKAFQIFAVVRPSFPQMFWNVTRRVVGGYPVSKIHAAAVCGPRLDRELGTCPTLLSRRGPPRQLPLRGRQEMTPARQPDQFMC